MMLDVIRRQEFELNLKRAEGQNLPLFYSFTSTADTVEETSNDMQTISLMFPAINSFYEVNSAWAVIKRKMSDNHHRRFLKFRNADFYKLQGQIPSIKYIPASMHSDLAEDVNGNPFELVYEIYFFNNWFPVLGG